MTLIIIDFEYQVAGHTFHPELVVYNAGTDILDGDPLGRLKVNLVSDIAFYYELKLKGFKFGL